MLNSLLKECEKEKEKLQRTRGRYSAQKGFQTYADGREAGIKAKEEIIKILCGIDGMTPATAEGILDDTKKLIATEAMRQPIKQSND